MKVSDAQLARALRHPIRERILRLLLATKTISPTTVAASMPNVTLPLVSHHVRTLVALGIIEVAGRHKRRGRHGHEYRLVADADQVRGQLWARKARVLRTSTDVDGTAILDSVAMAEFHRLTAAYLDDLASLDRDTRERRGESDDARATAVAILIATDVEL